MKRYKILIDCSTITKGGGLGVLVSNLNCLLNSESKFIYKTIIPKSLYDFLPETIQSNADIYWVDKKNIFQKLILILFLNFITIRFNPDLVYTIFGPQYYRPFKKHLVGFAKPSLIYPKIKENNFLAKNIKDFFSKYILKLADFYIVETQTVKKKLAYNLNIKKEKIFILKNSINSALIAIKKEQETNKKNKKNNLTKILVPSAYYPHKNLESIIPIAFKMFEIEKNFQFILTIEKEAFYKHFYLNLCNTKIKKNILNIGPQKISKLANYYLNSDIIFLPTLLECSTSVYPESFYFKVPLITSDLEFAKELCGKAALFCNPKDPNDCARKILDLMRNNDLREELILNGENQLKNYLGTKERKANLEKIFYKVIK